MHINDSLTNLSLTLIPQVQNKSVSFFFFLSCIILYVHMFYCRTNCTACSNNSQCKSTPRLYVVPLCIYILGCTPLPSPPNPPPPPSPPPHLNPYAWPHSFTAATPFILTLAVSFTIRMQPEASWAKPTPLLRN